MLPGLNLAAAHRAFEAFHQNETVRAIASAVAAVSLVVLSFQSLFFVARGVLTFQFVFMPLYFVITCAMIVFGIHFLGDHESQRTR